MEDLLDSWYAVIPRIARLERRKQQVVLWDRTIYWQQSYKKRRKTSTGPRRIFPLWGSWQGVFIMSDIVQIIKTAWNMKSIYNSMEAPDYSIGTRGIGQLPMG